jgi:hypothetical protein
MPPLPFSALPPYFVLLHPLWYLEYFCVFFIEHGITHKRAQKQLKHPKGGNTTDASSLTLNSQNQAKGT